MSGAIRGIFQMTTNKDILCKKLDQLLGFGEHDEGGSLDVLEHLLTIESREVRQYACSVDRNMHMFSFFTRLSPSCLFHFPGFVGIHESIAGRGSSSVGVCHQCWQISTRRVIGVV